MTEQSVYVVLLAAGKGARLGGNTPKPWCDLGGKPVLAHSLEKLAKHPAIQSGVIVVAETALKDAKPLADAFGWKVVVGGQERAFSVKAGLNSLSKEHPDYVLIHDAARPFVTDKVVSNLISTLVEDGIDAVVPGLPLADSLKKISGDLISDRVDRNQIWRVQTPQAFRFNAIKSCHDQDLDGVATDDSSLIEDRGGQVRIILGDAVMDKITTPEDLKHAQLIAASTHLTETRMAIGFDVHKFSSTPGPVIIGGVALDHEYGFDAHSDGDVALHALTDAIYGLMADGDIGDHFPPNDDQWKGKESTFFLNESYNALKSNGGIISFVDLTIIAEKPKIAPHREAIKSRIASLLGLSPTRVSVKATTTEGLGFTGRGEGIAVQAAVTAIFTSIESLHHDA